jgi:general transcription factor 3C polypeptide 3 (transcription factor C subunit 4)
MRDYQFTTDAYRTFAAVIRMCHAPTHWYNDNTSQKYVLRQVKTMDYALVSQEVRDKHFKDQKDKVSYSRTDENGEHVVNDDMDIVLLMVYGHLLYASQSYTHALSKHILPIMCFKD